MQAQAATKERRRHPRTHLNLAVGCVRLDPDGGDVLDRIHVLDISRSGVGALAERPFYPGQRVIVRLPLTAEGGRRNIYATVVRCLNRDDGYRIGLQFDTASVGLWSTSCAEVVAA